MTGIEFIKGQGGIPKILAGEDHISGFLMFCPEQDTPSGFTVGNRIHAISTIEKAKELGIDSSSPNWHTKALHYHLSEIFRINPAIVLYVGLFPEADDVDFNEIKEMQNFASGKLRQIGVYAPSLALSAEKITLLQGVADILDSQDQPLSILFAGKVSNLTTLENLSGIGKKNVSVVISQAGSGLGADLYNTNNQDKKSVTTIGNALAMVSLAAVNESISWVQKFPSGIDIPAFGDGALYKALDRAVIDMLDSNHYIFLKTFAGFTGSFYNDSHTMDMSTSDYNAIELVRTMDKAIRGIRTYLIPRLGAPLYVDPSEGTLRPDDVAFLEILAGKQLEEMERLGELSGYKVEIDPNQNVLASSCVEFIIKNIPVGVLRKIKVKIGFTNKI